MLNRARARACIAACQRISQSAIYTSVKRLGHAIARAHSIRSPELEDPVNVSPFSVAYVYDLYVYDLGLADEWHTRHAWHLGNAIQHIKC